jgi:S1-C subfamily serine protease
MQRFPYAWRSFIADIFRHTTQTMGRCGTTRQRRAATHALFSGERIMVQSLRLMLIALLTAGILLCGMPTRPVNAAVYRDKEGKLHISDTVPPGNDHTVVKPSKGGFTGAESPSAARSAPTAAASWDWVPVALPLLGGPDGVAKDAATIFATANKSIWTVIAAHSAKHLEQEKNLSQGSAVAVSQDKLLTNCHVVQGRSHLVVKHGTAQARATVISGDAATDRCVLAVTGHKLQPVSGYRTFASLTVGEPVYTIGSPYGLENTLGQGIISGLREAKGRRFVQTTAQASPGSSGGGLFDLAGNLVGITTFKVLNSDGLNFAIAVEDFTAK